MATSLTVDTDRSTAGNPVLRAAGEIDLSNIANFDQALTSAATEAGQHGETLTVDLSAVEYLDSAAINALCACSEHIRVIAPRLLLPTLTMSGLTELVEVTAAAPDN